MQNNTKQNKNKALQKNKTPDRSPKPSERGKMPLVANTFMSTPRVILFLFLLVFLLYGNTIFNNYSFDDDLVTYKNAMVHKGFRGMGEILRSNYATNAKQNYEYRPIVKLTYAIEYGMFKDNPHVSHFINVLLYFLLCVILYLLLRKLLKSYHPWLSLLTVVVFAVHPIHTEVVASLKNRDEILSLMGGLLSLYAFVRFMEVRKWYWIPVAVASLLFGYFSKSSVLVFLVIIPLTLYFFTDFKLRDFIWVMALLIAVILFSRMFPRTFLPKAHRDIIFFENPLYYAHGLWIRIGTALMVLLFYFKMLVVPHPLLFYYGYDQFPISTPGNPWAIVSFILCLALFVLAILWFKKKHLLSFAILFFFVSISQVTNIIKPPPGIVAERFLFSPSLGFALALVVLVMMLFKIDLRQKTLQLKNLSKPILLLALIVVPFGIRTIARNTDWKDYQTLYSHDIPYLDHSAKANSLYAQFLYDKIMQTKDMNKARQYRDLSTSYYHKAVKIYPKYYTCWNNLGVLNFKFYSDTVEAISCFKQAILSDSTYAEPVSNMGMLYEKKDPDSSKYYYKKAIKLKNDFAAVYTRLGGLYYAQDSLQKAIQINERLMRAIPTSDEPYINIGNYYLLNQDTVNAVAYWEKAIDKQAGNKKLNSVLANYFNRKGDSKKAEYYNSLAQKSKQ